jgi:hypothetical protein
VTPARAQATIFLIVSSWFFEDLHFILRLF